MFYNKPNGMAHLLRHADPPISEAVVALLDPDMVLMSALTPYVGESPVWFGVRVRVCVQRQNGGKFMDLLSTQRGEQSSTVCAVDYWKEGGGGRGGCDGYIQDEKHKCAGATTVWFLVVHACERT